MLTKKDIADQFQNLDYYADYAYIQKMAKVNDVLIIVGYSDDVTSIFGNVYDEVDNGKFHLKSDGVISDDDDDFDMDDFKIIKKSSMECESSYTDVFTCKIPCDHAEFTVMDGDLVYGTGYVIELSDLMEYIKNKK
jgi:hypothetical protein